MTVLSCCEKDVALLVSFLFKQSPLNVIESALNEMQCFVSFQL